MSALAVPHMRSVNVGPAILEYLERIDATLRLLGCALSALSLVGSRAGAEERHLAGLNWVRLEGAECAAAASVAKRAVSKNRNPTRIRSS
jgi:hypothetical protein